MLNNVVLIGRITRDVEVKKGASDGCFAPFTVAVNRPFSNQNGDKEVDFINCITFNKLAENLGKYCSKGTLVSVVGRLQTRSYTAQDGSNRIATEVIADKIIFLESKPKEDNIEPTPYDMPNPKVNSDKGNNPFYN